MIQMYRGNKMSKVTVVVKKLLTIALDHTSLIFVLHGEKAPAKL